MTYELVQFGLFKGLPALIVSGWGGAGRVKIMEEAQRAEEKLALINSKKHILFNLRDVDIEAAYNEEIALTFGMLRDMGFFVNVWVRGSQICTALRNANSTEIWLDPGVPWPQHISNSIILDFTLVSPEAFYIGKHLERVPKFLVVNEVTMDIVAFVNKMPQPVQIQEMGNNVRITV